MNYITVDAPQRSDEWFAARLGRLTGSRAADMLATIKTGEAAARKHLRTQLVLERLTGKSQSGVVPTAAIQQGVEREPLARDAYAERSGVGVREVGFLQHPELMAGCSPDGVIPCGVCDTPEVEATCVMGILEIKCPLAATHLDTLRSGWPAYNYERQILHNMWIAGAEWCDFVSFNPDFPQPLDLFQCRVWRDDAAIADYERKVRVFLYEVDHELAFVEGLMRAAK